MGRHDLAARHRAVDGDCQSCRRRAGGRTALRHAPNSARRTSISGALQFSSDLFAESGFQGVKRVIDISGDGPNNQGAPVDVIRDELVRQGITINGLPLMTRGGFTSVYDVNYLDRYYTDCVIGGPGAFMIPVNEWTQFPEAIRRKLVLELAGPAHRNGRRKKRRIRRWCWRKTSRATTARSARKCGATEAGCSTAARFQALPARGMRARCCLVYAASNCLRSTRSCCGERA